ncbi:MAG: hypothetical protein IPG66_18570 [Hydrogenophilales bacterium]|nr:hypothetical protein [Hydrogenophilales bacterium]
MHLTGRVTAGLMLSQALYWTRILADQPARQGWFWKTRDDWRNETGLSRREQDSARRTLKGLGLWQERLVGMPARVWYRVDLDALGKLRSRPPIPDGTGAMNGQYFNCWDARSCSIGPCRIYLVPPRRRY